MNYFYTNLEYGFVPLLLLTFTIILKYLSKTGERSELAELLDFSIELLLLSAFSVCAFAIGVAKHNKDKIEIAWLLISLLIIILIFLILTGVIAAIKKYFSGNTVEDIKKQRKIPNIIAGISFCFLIAIVNIGEYYCSTILVIEKVIQK